MTQMMLKLVVAAAMLFLLSIVLMACQSPRRDWDGRMSERQFREFVK
jgi:hypothetical protein